jgi:hypothetical protein
MNEEEEKDKHSDPGCSDPDHMLIWRLHSIELQATQLPTANVSDEPRHVLCVWLICRWEFMPF